jgi:uncharacterized protein (DUF924 family)
VSAQAVDEIVKFWFEELTPEDWYRKDPSIDAQIRTRFGGIYDTLKSDVPETWLGHPSARPISP